MVLCTASFESASRKGRVRNRMESVQEVTINFYRHMFVLSYMYFTF